MSYRVQGNEPPSKKYVDIVARRFSGERDACRHARWVLEVPEGMTRTRVVDARNRVVCAFTRKWYASGAYGPIVEDRRGRR